MSRERTKARLKRYPQDWKAIVAQVRARSGDRCECSGECGLHGGELSFRCWAEVHCDCEWPLSCICLCHPEHSTRCTERNGQPARWARGKVVLTTAHVCPPESGHDESCGDLEHLKSMCQRCHLRVDGPLHVRHAAETRERKRLEAAMTAGQGELFGGAP